MTPREKAYILRKKGFSYTDISKRTGLAKSTLSYHLSDVEYVPNDFTIKKIGQARIKAASTKNKNKNNSIKEAKQEALSEIGEITSRDIFMIGLGLYIGEGNKTHNVVRVVNSDYRVLKLTIKWLELLGLKKENFSLRIHLYPQSDIKKAHRFWLEKLQLTEENLQRPYIDNRKNKSLRKVGKSKYGTAHLTVKANGKKEYGVFLSRKISAYMNKVLDQ